MIGNATAIGRAERQISAERRLGRQNERRSCPGDRWPNANLQPGGAWSPVGHTRPRRRQKEKEVYMLCYPIIDRSYDLVSCRPLVVRPRGKE